MTMEDIRAYESKMHTETNKKVGVDVPESPVSIPPSTPTNTPVESTPEEKESPPGSAWSPWNV